jgi:hypothetical protein
MAQEIKLEVKNKTLIITCPLNGGTPSKTGKSLVVATTNGFVEVPNSNIRVNLNAIKPLS